MIRNFLVSTLRNVLRNQNIILINVFGFATAMACCLLIGLYIVDEYSFDRYHAKADRIYRVALDRIYPDRSVRWAPIPPAVRDGLLAEIPEVEEATRITHAKVSIKTNDKKGFDENVIAVDPSFLKIFSHEFIAGDPTTSLKDASSLIITRGAAEKFFPNQNAIGKSMTLENMGLFAVTAVIENIPQASHLRYDFITSFAWDKQTDFGIWDSNFGYYTYLLLKDKASPAPLDEKLAQMSKKYLSVVASDYSKWRADGNDYRFFTQPLLDIHLYSNLKWEVDVNGNYLYVYIFSGVGLLILIIACINFINLSTARYSIRVKEVSIKKILGSRRSQLLMQFMLESLVLSTMAILISLVFSELALPFLNDLLNKNLTLPYFSNFILIPVLLFAAVIVGLLSGIYPALLLSSFKPTHLLGGSAFSSKYKSNFRNRLVIFQFMISFVLIAGTWVVFSQIQFMKNKDLGMTRENILVIDGVRGIRNKSVFKEMLLSRNEIGQVGGAAAVIGKMEGAGTFRPKGFNSQQELNMTMLGVDTDLIKAWGLQLTEGRDFIEQDYADTNRYVILNESAVKQFGWPDDPIGKELLGGNDQVLRVVGVVKDFHLETLRREIRPLLMLPSKDWINTLSLRVSTENLSETIAFSESKWKEVMPDKPFHYFFLDDFYQNLYQSERTTEILFIILSCLAIFIASLGLFGLSAFMAEQRTKEIGIRKVVGASVFSITLLLVKDLSKLVLISVVLGIPIAWYLASNWLQNFAYRIDLSSAPFLLSGLASLLITFFTVSFHAFRASQVNPTETLKAQ